MKGEITAREEESDNNYMSDDSSMSSNHLEDQPSRKATKKDF